MLNNIRCAKNETLLLDSVCVYKLHGSRFMVRLWIMVRFDQCIRLGDELSEVFQVFVPDFNQVLMQH